MNYTPVPSTFYQPALHSTSFQSPAPNHQQLVPFLKSIGVVTVITQVIEPLT